ncbi:aminotransferase class V-fold PLP-dependent enzyme [Petroclostridium sp. X23]|uniref:aminotransferase class V-fold PLP-dependent enzyme n=1 Tax=Petroclostridium sp. X23 TaxID=3045146 RepID=UPI0024AD62D0|nr:aminotransferase class V-fold PLP-dependent enzyme [Petroclostridium sp. X23]WHH58348.1 aminotransferase class V-fold PLP-dependent enzyme [Petroclostridium sp. X23]
MVYLDNAATTWPKPYAVCDEMLKCMKNYCANPGRSGHRMALRASEKIYECRENIAKLFVIPDPLCVSFTSNTTEALNKGIKGLVKPGDHVITTSMEHNSVLRPLKKLEQLGVELTIVKADAYGRVSAEMVENSINNNTKLIVAIHASNVYGTVNPVKEIGRIAREKKIVFMVDAAQTAGVYPIDVEDMNVDILAFPGHKGLMGPQGTGGLYVREDLVLDTLTEGGTGSMSESPYQPDFVPDRYESGTQNTPGIAALNEGVKFILANGMDSIMQHEKELTRRLLDGLRSIPRVRIYGDTTLKENVGVVSINIEGKDCVDVSSELDSTYEIATRGGLHCAYIAHETLGTLECGTVRLSIGWFNTKKDIDWALYAISRIAKN